MDKKNVTYAIGTFIQKNCNDANRVKWPTWNFTIKQILNVILTETSLQKVSANLWTFDATAEIVKTDSHQTVTMKEKVGIVGNANVVSYINEGTTEESLEVKTVTITKIKSSATHNY